jgi:hypothetical protein
MTYGQTDQANQAVGARRQQQMPEGWSSVTCDMHNA